MFTLGQGILVLFFIFFILAAVSYSISILLKVLCEDLKVLLFLLKCAAKKRLKFLKEVLDNRRITSLVI
jgi:hypothetical protein